MGQEFWSSLAGQFWLGVSREAIVEMLAEDIVLWKLDGAGGSPLKMAPTCDLFGGQGSGLFHINLSQGCASVLMTWQLVPHMLPCFQQVIENESQAEAILFNDLGLVVS